MQTAGGVDFESPLTALTLAAAKTGKRASQTELTLTAAHYDRAIPDDASAWRAAWYGPSPHNVQPMVQDFNCFGALLKQQDPHPVVRTFCEAQPSLDIHYVNMARAGVATAIPFEGSCATGKERPTVCAIFHAPVVASSMPL